MKRIRVIVGHAVVWGVAVAMTAGGGGEAWGWEREATELGEFVHEGRVNNQEKRIKVLREHCIELENLIREEGGWAGEDLPRFDAEEDERLREAILDLQARRVRIYEEYCEALERYYERMSGKEDDEEGGNGRGEGGGR